MKKLFALLAALCLFTGLLAGCGGDASTAQTGSTSGGVSTGASVQAPETITLGVLQYDNTDAAQMAINAYYRDYMGPALGIEFIFSENITSAEEEMTFLERCASSGAKGVMAFYQVAGNDALLAKLEETQLYYIVGGELDSGLAESGSPWILGGFAGMNSEYATINEMTKHFLNEGDRTFTIATGGKDFGVEMFINRYNGFADAIEEWNEANPDDQATFTEFPGFPDDFAVWSANVQKTIEEAPDCIIATFSGENLWATPLSQAGAADSINLGTFSAINEASAAALMDGSLDYLAAQHPQGNVVTLLAMYNACTVGVDAYFTSGIPMDLPFFTATFVGGTDILPYTASDFYLVTADEAKSVCAAWTPGATVEDLVALGENISLD